MYCLFAFCRSASCFKRIETVSSNVDLSKFLALSATRAFAQSSVSLTEGFFFKSIRRRFWTASTACFASFRARGRSRQRGDSVVASTAASMSAGTWKTHCTGSASTIMSPTSKAK